MESTKPLQSFSCWTNWFFKSMYTMYLNNSERPIFLPSGAETLKICNMQRDAKYAACQLLPTPTVCIVKTMFFYWTCENIIEEFRFNWITVMLHTLSEDFFPGCTIRNSLMITSIPPVGIVCNKKKRLWNCKTHSFKEWGCP